MPAISSLTITSHSPQHSCDLAQALSVQLKAGDVILLTGDVGAGKTHFARCAILAHLEKAEDIPSPTYTLVQTYNGFCAEIWHADLYRLTSVSEVEELGLYDAFTKAICLVEWPDRLGEQVPEDALHLLISDGAEQDQRTLVFSWSDPRWASLLQELAHDGA